MVALALQLVGLLHTEAAHVQVVLAVLVALLQERGATAVVLLVGLIVWLSGVGATKFGGGTHFTVMAGAGYRLLLTDKLAAHLDVRDHVFQNDLLGYQKTVHNLETTLGVTTYF